MRIVGRKAMLSPGGLQVDRKGASALLFQVRAGTIFTHPLYAYGSYGYPA
jgi:hypothetical protein